MPDLLPSTYEVLRTLMYDVRYHGCTQGTIDALKHKLVEAQQMRDKDAEKHRREEARLQERHEALIRFTKVMLTFLFPCGAAWANL